MKWQDPRGLVWQCGVVVVHDCPLNHHSGGSRRLVSTFFPGRKCPHICKGIHWWWIKWISNSPWKRCGYCNPICILVFLCRPLHPIVWTHPGFQFTATVFMSMAARLSDLDEQKPGTNSQKEGHTLTPPSNQNGPEDPEAFGSAPSWSPSQSLARKPEHPKTWYCLEIQVISTEDDKVIPPPSHTQQAPIVEDMVQEGRAGLTEAVVTGSGQAILFCGWQSLGEGLSLGEVRDATFTLSGIIAWVGKQAQLSTKPVSLADGGQLVTFTFIRPWIQEW